MKYLILLLIFGCAQETTIPEPIQPDCNCGEVVDVSVIYDTDTKRTEYTHKLFNLCTGNIGYKSDLNFTPIGEIICVDYKW